MVGGYPGPAASRLTQMDASSRERMLVAGVRVLVGGAAVVLSGAGGGRQVMQYMPVFV